MGGMVPEDVYELTGVSDPRLSPDGATVAYVVDRVDREANEYRGTVWLAAADGSREPRPFTAGPKSDGDPRWSPDGATLAFTSNRDGKVAQLYVMPVGGGEARRLTDLKEDVTQPAWSPDGSTIVFVSRVRDAAYDEEDDKKREPRRITRLQYKHDDVGWTFDRRQHLFTVRADGSEPAVQLTGGDFEDTGPVWSPDGGTIGFVSARHEDWDLQMVSDVYLLDAAGGEPRRLTQGGGSVGGLAWAPDGARLAVQYYPGDYDDPKNTQVGVVDAVSGEIRLLSQALDRDCGGYGAVREPVWAGADILFPVDDRGRTHVYRVAADGSGAPELVVGGERELTGFDARAGRIVFSALEPARLAELYAADGGAPEGGRRLTAVGEAFAAARDLPAPERYTAVSPDGAEVEAWVVRPAGFEPGRKYPTLLSIHGGPFAQYGVGFFDEFQVYAAAGYVVLYANPRGSSGYSEEWGRAIRGPGEAGPGWGSVDYDDCMAVVDEALRRFDFVDPERLGVLGGSYGGYMTTWIVARTGRFKAAISERSLNYVPSQWGSGDYGWDFKGYLGTFLWEDVPAYLAVSPSTYAQDIHTPLLILHSEEDLRCPVEQGEHLFVTLRLLKRPVEMVRFPKESHELSRSGSPRHRVRRFEIILEFMDRHLKDGKGEA